MKSRQLRLALLGLALGVLLALTLAPQTRWLVRLQTLASLSLYHPFPSAASQSYTLSQTDDARRMQDAEARHPNDFTLRYAQAIAGDSGTEIRARLRVLEPQFPDQPQFYAGLLRYAVEDLHWNRFEETHLYDLPQPASPPKIVPNDPRTLAAFDREAATGERLDPDNAYFPIMRAVGLFAAHRDTEGWAAVERASKETQWREYVPEEVEARWRLHTLAFGDPGAFPRSTIAFTTPFPQYAKLRALARFLLFGAVEKEKAGRFEEGLQRREALRHYGDLMQSQSTTLITSLVGGALCTMAISQPGGVRLPKSAQTLKPEQAAQLHLKIWSAYVTRLGHPELAAQARAEAEAFQQMQAVVARAQSSSITEDMFRLAAWWLAGLATLANIGWLLVFGGLAAALTRTRGIQEGGEETVSINRRAAAKQSIAAVGIVAVLFFLADRFLQFFSLTGLFGSIFADVEKLFLIFLILAVFGLPPACAVYFMRHGVRRSRFSSSAFLQKIGITFFAVLLLVVFWNLALWQAAYLAEIVEGLRSLTQLSDGPETLNSQDGTHWLSLAAVLTVPLLLALALVIASLTRRIPVSIGLVQGTRNTALPLACLLLLLWGGLLLGTARQEQIENQRLWHIVHDEGPYYAAQAGLPWPGLVR